MNHTFSIGFYNLENLFEPLEGSSANGGTPGFKDIRAWDEPRYRKKIENLATAISRIGASESGVPPVFMGVCEVETDRCLEDLVGSEALREHDYGFIHYNSGDRRGLDTAFIYQKRHFRVLGSKTCGGVVSGRSGEEGTRDILHIEGELFTVPLHVLVNHWPSRIRGKRSTKHKRQELARELKNVVEQIYRTDPMAKIIIAGDFNDNPSDFSLSKILDQQFVNGLNPSNQKTGTSRYRKRWVFFDQILMNENLLCSKSLSFRETQIFNPPFLVQHHGRFKGAPRRTFQGSYCQGGYSDHFPVYALFECHEPVLPSIKTLSRS